MEISTFYFKAEETKIKDFKLNLLQRSKIYSIAENASVLLISFLTNTMAGKKVEATTGNNLPIKWHGVSDSVGQW